MKGFGTFGSSEASRSAGTIDWDGGIRRKGLLEALGHPSEQRSPSRRFFERLWILSGEFFWTVLGRLAVLEHPEV